MKITNPFKRVNARPMFNLILTHLQQGNSISSVEAQAIWRCRDLPKRISEIRKAGYRVVSEPRTDSTGQRYNRYSMPKENA